MYIYKDFTAAASRHGTKHMSVTARREMLTQRLNTYFILHLL